VVKVLWKETAFPRWRATDSCLPGVFSDGCHSSAQLLHQFHCSIVPAPCCLYGNWNKLLLLLLL